MSELKRQILSFLFALLCLLSSMQVVLNYHFCSEKLVHTSINKALDSCCLPVDHQLDHIGDDCADSTCCDDVKFIKTTQEFTSNFSETGIDFELLSYTIGIDVFSPCTSTQITENCLPKVIEVIRDFQSRYCVYRI